MNPSFEFIINPVAIIYICMSLRNCEKDINETQLGKEDN